MAVEQVSDYSVDVAGRKLEVQLQHEDGADWAVIGGRRVRVNLLASDERGRFTLSIDGQKHPVVMSSNGSGYELYLYGRTHEVSVERSAIKELRKHLKSTGPSGSDAGVVESHMPGLIVKINVDVGERVEVGDALLVIEAMKMENEIRSPLSGVVEKIAVEPGNEVSGGQTLCILKAEA